MILFVFILTITLLFLVLIKIYWFMIDKIEEEIYKENNNEDN